MPASGLPDSTDSTDLPFADRSAGVSSDPDASCFFALLSDAVTHRYLEVDSYWPDSWHMLRDIAEENATVQAALMEDGELAFLYLRLWVLGLQRGYDRVEVR